MRARIYAGNNRRKKPRKVLPSLLPFNQKQTEPQPSVGTEFTILAASQEVHYGKDLHRLAGA